MRKDVGIDGDAQRLGQLVWMVFLKVFDDRELEWELFDPNYVSPIPEQLRWRSWASNDEGVTGNELLVFVNDTLLPGLKALAARPGADPERGQVVRGVFKDAYNYMKSGTLIRQVVNILARDLDYNATEDRHAFGDIYETLLKGLQSAGDAGEYYTPRPVTQFMVDVVGPKLGEIVLDPACGTGGFLLCALNHVRDNHVDTIEDDVIAQESIRGVEKKPLPHLLCTTNMLLHGVDVPTEIRRDNTLARPLRDYGPRDRVDIIVTNPPFRGTEEDGIELNFPAKVRTRETADLFLALTLHILKPDGRAAIVLPDSSLFGDNVKQILRERLLEETNLHTIVRLPYGVFSPYTDIRTNLLFFDKGQATKDVWFYELTPLVGEKYTKTKPITHDDFNDLREWWDSRTTNEHAWRVSAKDLAKRNFNLNIPNPHSLDIQGAIDRATTTRNHAQKELDELLTTIYEDSASWDVDVRTRRFLTQLADLAPHVRLTSGVVETLRVKLTELALSGGLSNPELDDSTIEETLARYNPSDRTHEVVGFPEPPFAIPSHWRWRRVHEITDFSLGRTPSTKDLTFWCQSGQTGIPWISISDMSRRGIVSETSRQLTEKGAAVFTQAPVAPGTLLMAFKLSVGKTAISSITAFHNEAIASFETTDEVLKYFLLWALPCVAPRASANPAVRGNTLNTKSIAGVWVPVPPYEEQERIVSALRWAVDLVEELAYAAEELRIASDRLLKLLSMAGEGVPEIEIADR
jgi:type I restriction enzyme M protein